MATDGRCSFRRCHASGYRRTSVATSAQWLGTPIARRRLLAASAACHRSPSSQGSRPLQAHINQHHIPSPNIRIVVIKFIYKCSVHFLLLMNSALLGQNEQQKNPDEPKTEGQRPTSGCGKSDCSFIHVMVTLLYRTLRPMPEYGTVMWRTRMAARKNFAFKIAAKPLQIGYYWQPIRTRHRRTSISIIADPYDVPCGHNTTRLAYDWRAYKWPLKVIQGQWFTCHLKKFM